VIEAATALPPLYLTARRPSDASQAGIFLEHGRVRVGVSRLHGFGVFAASTIPPVTLLGEYVGKVMRVRPIDCTYVMCVTVDRNEHLWIDASDPADSNWTRYLNDPGDGAQASCELRQNDLAVEVWSCRRSISPGEELTVKYMTWNSPLGVPDGSTPRRSTRKPRPRRSRSVSPPASLVRQVRPSCAPPSLPARKPRRLQPEKGSQQQDCDHPGPVGGLSTEDKLRAALREVEALRRTLRNQDPPALPRAAPAAEPQRPPPVNQDLLEVFRAALDSAMGQRQQAQAQPQPHPQPQPQPQPRPQPESQAQPPQQQQQEQHCHECHHRRNRSRSRSRRRSRSRSPAYLPAHPAPFPFAGPSWGSAPTPPATSHGLTRVEERVYYVPPPPPPDPWASLRTYYGPHYGR
jgi:hypothetical protein